MGTYLYIQASMGTYLYIEASNLWHPQKVNSVPRAQLQLTQAARRGVGCVFAGRTARMSKLKGLMSLETHGDSGGKPVMIYKVLFTDNESQLLIL